jgi:hypothetical protein
VPERSTGSDPGDNAHPRGALVRYQRIAGHRDADFTDCPGTALYELLPQVRRAVAALMPAPRDLLTLSPVGASIDQAPWPLTGRLARADGSRPAGAVVQVQQRAPDGSWQQVAATRTAADGIWKAAPTLLVDGPLRAVAPALGLASPAVPVLVRARVRLRVSPARLRAGGALRIAGATTPAKARVRVQVQPRTSAGRHRRGVTRDLATTAGRFDLPVRLTRPGVYRVLVTTRADAANAAGSSRAVTVRVLSGR